MPTVNDANGNPLRVGENGFAYTYAITTTLAAHASEDGDGYSVDIQVDTGAVTCDFFYLKNLSDHTLRIHSIKAKAHDTDTEVQIKLGVLGDPTGGTELTPVNSLVGSGSVAELVCEQRAAGDMDLSGGDIFDRLFLDAASIGEQVYNYPGEIALLKNQAMLLHAPTDTGGVVNITIRFFFHEKV